MGDFHACPVRLFFTPQIATWLDLFRQTHELRVGMAGALWERTSDIRRLPALAVEAITVIRDTWNGVLLEERPAPGGAR